MAADFEIIERINECLDSVRKEQSIRRDSDLATHLNVSMKTVSFWRHGHIPKTTMVLLRVLAHCSGFTATEGKSTS
jgi:DNA-binding transcriptional regulator YiaG